MNITIDNGSKWFSIGPAETLENSYSVKWYRKSDVTRLRTAVTPGEVTSYTDVYITIDNGSEIKLNENPLDKTNNVAETIVNYLDSDEFFHISIGDLWGQDYPQ